MVKEHLLTKIGQYAIIIRDKKLLFLVPVKGEYLMFVGGRLDSDDENPQEALAREIQEETQLDLVNLEPFDVKLWSVNSKNHRYAVFFLCEIKDLEKEIILSHEHTDYMWYSYEETINSNKIGLPGKEVIEKLHKKGHI
ncbi:MAG: NUDIX hydrolase [Nanoarchaeota archaeon]|nr:NUDIX hydrolase [Nanoarchaeota archaeon]